jgi:hypothetical protein
MGILAHGGFLVTTKDKVFSHTEGIRTSTLKKIIDALAIESPTIGQLKDITSIFVFTPTSTPKSES